MKRFIVVGLLCLFGLMATTLKAEKKIKYWVVIYAVRNHNRSERVLKKAKEQFNEKVEMTHKPPHWQVRIGVSTRDELKAVSEMAKGLGYWPRVYKAKVKIDDETAFKRQKKLERGTGALLREIESSPQNRLVEIAQWLSVVAERLRLEREELQYQLTRSEKEKDGLVLVGEELAAKKCVLESIVQKYEKLEFENEDLKRDLKQARDFKVKYFVLLALVFLVSCGCVILGRFYLKLKETEKEVREEKEKFEKESDWFRKKFKEHSHGDAAVDAGEDIVVEGG